MKMFFAVIMAVMLIGGMGGVAQAVDFSGYAKLGYPIDSGIEKTNGEISARLDIDTNYKFESKLNAKINDKLNLYVGFDAGAGVASDDYTFGAEYSVIAPFGVFIEHTDHDMKGGLPDYDVTWAGIVLKIE